MAAELLNIWSRHYVLELWVVTLVVLVGGHCTYRCPVHEWPEVLSGFLAKVLAHMAYAACLNVLRERVCFMRLPPFACDPVVSRCAVNTKRLVLIIVELCS